MCYAGFTQDKIAHVKVEMKESIKIMVSLTAKETVHQL
jgi:hypothetical protein